MREAHDPLSVWRRGNRVRLLENGEEYFERVFAAIAAAKEEIRLETFILFDDKVGQALQRKLIEAARRGVRVDMLVDSYGSPALSTEFTTQLTSAGVRLRMFDQHPTLLGIRLHVFRRMHRKLLVVDHRLAFAGGINYSADHLADFGPTAKQDYAIEVEGPVVEDIDGFVSAVATTHGTGERWRPARDTVTAPVGEAEAMFVPRDNDRRSRSIEREYRRAIRGARRTVTIANAYFFPGYGFLHDLREAARRGVTVSLVVQGEPDTAIALTAARTLYRHLIDAGVRIYEYCERPFHGKIALVDEDWSTVGSSNLEPLSLSLNLEANIFVRDTAFAAHLRSRLDELLRLHCREVDAARVPRGRIWQPITRPLLFHCLRKFPDWAGWVPAHTPKTAVVRPEREPGDEA